MNMTPTSATGSAAGSAAGSATRSAKRRRVALAASGSKTAKRDGLNNTQFRQLVSNPGLTINQLTKLRIEAGNRGQQNVVNNISRRIENRRSQGATRRKITPRPRGRAPNGKMWDPIGGQWVPNATPVGSNRSLGSATSARSAKKPKIVSIKNIKASMRARGTAALTPKATPETLARQVLTDEQFRNQITKILNTRTLSKATLRTLKGNANQRLGMNNISTRINSMLLNVARSARKSAPKSAPVVNKTYKVAATKMVSSIKTAYLNIIKRRIKSISDENGRKPAKLYFLYETFRIVSASVIHRRWVKLYGMPTTIDENKIEEDLDANFIPVYKDITKVVRLKNISETQPTVINFNQQQLFRWFFLMWLDSHHDGTTSATSSFFTYLNFINVNKNFIQAAIKSYDYGNDVLLTSGFFGKIIQNGDITPPTKGKFEAIMKTQLFKFFKYSNNVVSVRRKSKINNGKLSVALDQEHAASISIFITGNHNNAINKITVANFMDPGVYMQNGIGLNDDFDKFFVSNSNNAEMFKRLNNDYIVNTFSFSLRYKDVPFMELRTFLNSYNNLDPVNYEKSRPIKLELKYLMNNGIMSDWKDVTPSKKEKNTTFEGVMNKYFGDCLQGLVIATNNRFRPSNPIHLATGDGAFVGVFGNICDAIEVPTRLVVDNALAEGILDIYHLPDDIEITTVNKPNASGNFASSRMY